MRFRWACLSLALVGIGAGSASAQQPGTAVQLPTFSFFGVNTTVSVPDRGSVYMGGVNRAASARNEFGTPLLPFRPFKNTAIGSERSASSIRVSVFIHDFEAMEAELLSRPSPGREQATWQLSRPMAAALGQTLPPPGPPRGESWQTSSPANSTSRPQMSVADAQSQRLSQRAVRSDEAVRFFERGRDAEEAGKPNVAKIYYQMAARRAGGGDFKQQVVDRLEALGRAGTASKIAQSPP